MEIDKMNIDDNEVHPTDSKYKSFDLENYAANYKGRNRINRLIFIANSCNQLSVQALKLLLKYIKEDTYDINNYLKYQEKYQNITNDPTIDIEWTEKVKKLINEEQKKIDSSVTPTNDIDLKRENIRLLNKMQGDLCYKCGNIKDAQKYYNKNKDFSNTSQHLIETYVDLIKTYFDQLDEMNVKTYITKIESKTSETKKNTDLKNIMKCYTGLCNVRQKNYKSAARIFTEIDIELNDINPEIIAPNDIAIYGGLCALVAFTRSELKNKVIENTKFKTFLELEPQILDLIKAFYNSKYITMLEILDSIKSSLLLDIHLKAHVEDLYKIINEKAFVQYFSPFQTVDMNKMAKSFNMSVTELQEKLVKLIASNSIKARIDSHNKILYAKRADQRNNLFRKTLKLGEENKQIINDLLLRMKMEEKKMIVTKNNNENKIQGQLHLQVRPGNLS
ncbi:PCI-domain-containing protein [Piromyces finnis]|uniref:PCI-domain-containing protein n=1 Tax=Piromyces finnis TaxID=1754191 RepID=A0A1Y1VLH5_9FUNG|nr:PCI-domain-containing protein [Piromyces finnis]|eukprot:ORX58618.1 PCI-domain-containing protein [Piromyces finnis]